MMMEHVVYIGIGSNLDVPLNQVKRAIRQLTGLKQSRFIRSSSFYSSKPMGPKDQPDYINAVVLIMTSLSAIDLLDELQQIEMDQGRVRSGPRWGPRSLDLDILLYDENIINTDRLLVPHPGLHERAFVLYPLYEINPDLIIPGKGRLAQWKAKCPQGELEKIIQ